MSAAREALLAALEREHEAREARGLARRLVLPRGVDFASNDYLGYAQDAALAARVAEGIRAEGVGGGGARLLGGHRALHARVEARLAAFAGREAALLYGSGYAANLGFLTALLGPEDVVYSDALIHASLIDGVRLSRATRRIFPHQDLAALERLLSAPEDAAARRRLVVVESVYSTEGDRADLAAVVALAERHRALVYVDEAHATGLFGARGSGCVEALGLSGRVLATVHTGGKALGAGGAWIASDTAVIRALLSTSRSFVFTTAPVPAIPLGLEAALDRLAGDGARVAALHAQAEALRARLRAGGLDVGRSASPIVPVMLGDAPRALRVAEALQAEGYDVRALRPKTVPEGTARLRITVRSPHGPALLEALAARVVAHAREDRR